VAQWRSLVFARLFLARTHHLRLPAMISSVRQPTALRPALSVHLDRNTHDVNPGAAPRFRWKLAALLTLLLVPGSTALAQGSPSLYTPAPDFAPTDRYVATTVLSATSDPFEYIKTTAPAVAAFYVVP
jgi:hypothetical protein